MELERVDVIKFDDLRIHQDSLGRMWFSSGSFTIFLEKEIVDDDPKWMLDALRRLSKVVNKKASN